MNVEEEVERLKEEIQRLGKVRPDGSYKNQRVRTEKDIGKTNIYSDITRPLWVLFNDDRCAHILEALAHMRVNCCYKESMLMSKSFSSQHPCQHQEQQLLRL
ncbi:hypothetical protein NC651_036491 [Populus alba x Populus x berolinensis]|nr:hypothetical protein NC651_036491 [Populus alba x Populus x berolinensis]